MCSKKSDNNQSIKMHPSRVIKLKALFLLVSFSLNSVAGFACSLGIDLGYNHHHHECEEKHSHKHKGHAESGTHNDEDCIDEHQEKSQQEQSVNYNAPENDNCCSGFVIGYQSTDKEIVQKAFPTFSKIDHVFFQISTVLLEEKLYYSEPVRIPPKIPDHSPPPDIRVLIQSFQI